MVRLGGPAFQGGNSETLMRLQAFGEDAMADGKVPKLVFAVPKKTFEDLKAQPVVLDARGDGKSQFCWDHSF